MKQPNRSPVGGWGMLRSCGTARGRGYLERAIWSAIKTSSSSNSGGCYFLMYSLPHLIGYIPTHGYPLAPCSQGLTPIPLS